MKFFEQNSGSRPRAVLKGIPEDSLSTTAG